MGLGSICVTNSDSFLDQLGQLNQYISLFPSIEYERVESVGHDMHFNNPEEKGDQGKRRVD